MSIRQWDEALSTDETNLFCKGLVHLLAGNIYHQETKSAVLAAIDRMDVKWFCEFEPCYDGLTAADAMMLVQILALFQKRADVDLGVDKAKVAYEKFESSEQRCGQTNELFRLWSSGSIQFRPSVEGILHAAQRKIASVLGDLPTVDQLRPRFGPGATTQIPKRTASARRKLSETFACSEEFTRNLSTFLSELPAWIPYKEDSDTAVVTVEIQPGVLHFVPKNAKTDRSIVIEPSLNSFFQLAYGDYIADRLRLRGQDIHDQARNQNLARVGSLYGELATLDLSSASDTISRELVAHLLPIDWFLMLDSLRTGEITHEGKARKLQKFSSMGNGFTFPLETLIFWALGVSCIDESQGEVCSVYGDDIIVPVRIVPLLREVLNSCGFLLNSSKSFWSGPFRESCGADYHSGIPIRPVFLKDRLSGESAFIMHNFFVRHDSPELAAYVLSYIDKDLQLFGPDGYGDGHLLSSDHVGTPYGVYHPDKTWWQWRGHIFETYTWKSRKSYKALPGDYVYSLYSIYQKETEPRPLDGPQYDRRDLIGLLARRGSASFRRIYGEEVFSTLIKQLQGLSTTETPYDKRSKSFGVTLPGTQGYKRIRIYTLT